ncbi:MAG: choice-of-anchor D domain-containing protein [Dehalococcoidales bacterium]|nr:choice-of-anchor D domain-containing protein [Dehalococcoidales bacterium]
MTIKHLKYLSLILALSLLVAGMPLAALAWSTDSTVNNPICTETQNQEYPQLVSDGAGGAIIVWQDERNGNYDIYAQRVNSSGIAQWTDNGTAVCTSASDQEYPQLVSDGAGGAIITWRDNRNSNYDIYAQRVNSSGIAQWTDNGTVICNVTNGQDEPQLVSDDSGGAIIVWQDNRQRNDDIYAQWINSSGIAQWTDNGTAICNVLGSDQSSPQLVYDDSGGAIITWVDYRSGTNDDVYAQRINSAGNTLWTDNGTAVCTSASDQEYPQLVSDGAGGAIITWYDYRSTNFDIYAQRINNLGNTLWTDNGTAICNVVGSEQYFPQIVTDGSGGAIIVWTDRRDDIPNHDIYAQRVNADGSANWTTDNGTAICNVIGSDQNFPRIVSDDSGGAIITWMDYRSSNEDIYAQRVNADGSANWTTDNGTAICTAGGGELPQLVSDGDHGAIITWEDYRNGNVDIYAQLVNSSGGLGTSPDISRSPTTINFGSVASGASSPAHTVTISNAGSSDNSLTVGTITIGGASAAEFSKQNDTASGQVIAPGGSATLEVVFSPTSAGSKTASLSIPSDDPGEATVTVSLSGSSPSPAPPPSDGGGRGDYSYSNSNMLGTTQRLITDSTGKVYRTVEATSADGMLTVTIPKGTVMKNKNGKALHTLDMAVNDNPPPPPEDTNIIGLAYAFGPAGATFAPPFTLSFQYDPEALPEGVAAEDLVLAFYDEAAGEWVELECTVDTETHTVTALVSHFTDFALLGKVVPAAFSLSNLTVTPAEVEVGKDVTVTVSVANTGGISGTAELVLKINEADVETKNVDVAAGESATVSFTVSRQEAATYTVDVNGIKGKFMVLAPPPVSKPVPVTPPTLLPAPPAPPPPPPESGINWMLIGVVTAGVIIIIFFTTYYFKTRRD